MTMSRSQRVVASLFSLVFSMAIAWAQEPAPASPPPPPMTWAELVARPELWPTECVVQVSGKVGEHEVAAGSTYPVLELRATEVSIRLGEGARTGVPSEKTDALARANAAFVALPPAQRALDLAMLRQRADLWPTQVGLRTALQHADGKVAASVGALVALGSFDGNWLRVQGEDKAAYALPPLPVHWTDFVARCRAAFDAAPDPKARGKRHRVLAELDGKLVDAVSGKKARLSPTAPPDYVVLYFSAGWCPPCRKFSPELVAFYRQHQKLAGKRFEVIWVSRDNSEREQRQYAKAAEFPFLAVAWDQLGKAAITQAHGPDGIPILVLLDRNGALLADSFVGTEYRGPEAVLKTLGELLTKPK